MVLRGSNNGRRNAGGSEVDALTTSNYRATSTTRSVGCEGTMTPTYFSALAALAGAMIGGLTSFANSWLTQHNQLRFTEFGIELLAFGLHGFPV